MLVALTFQTPLYFYDAKVLRFHPLRKIRSCEHTEI